MQAQSGKRNLAFWKETVGEIIEDPRVSRYLAELDARARRYIESLPQEERARLSRTLDGEGDHKAHVYQLADALLPHQDESMRSYAESWFAVSQGHAEAGLYRRAVEFFNPQPGLLVDIGCGAGFFLKELPFRSVLGVDINHYCLQLAEVVLGQDRRPVRRYSKSYISFDPDKGFVLKPLPVMDELDFNQTNLLLDDGQNLQNTIRVLYSQGRKADAVAFTLHGGYSNKSALNFIDAMRFGDAEKFMRQRYLDVADYVDSIVRNIGKVCRSGGSLFLGLRASVFHGENGALIVDPDNIAQDLAERFKDQIEVERVTAIELEDENHSGIVTTPKRVLEDGSFEDVPPELKDSFRRYHLYLIDAKVKGGRN